MGESDREGFPRMTLGEHLEELRRRIIYSLAGLAVGLGMALFFGNRIIDALKYSYVVSMRRAGMEEQLAVPTVTSGFTTYLSVSLIAGIVIASPWIFCQLWMFVSAGLYKRERRYVVYAVPLSAALFLGGVVFFLFGVSMQVMRFFIGFNRWMGVKPVIMLKDHIRFVTQLMLVFGLAFQTPLVVLMLAKMGLVTIRTLNKYRRHVIVAIALVAAILTPPDLFSQLALGVPMWLLYELGVLLSYLLVARKKAPSEV